MELPFETKGLDDAVPSIDFSPTGSNDLQYSLERMDIDGNLSTIHKRDHVMTRCCPDFFRVLDDLDHFAKDTHDVAAEASVQDARSKLEKLVGKMDGLEPGFDRIAERSRGLL